jgi:hypothetical protein
MTGTGGQREDAERCGSGQREGSVGAHQPILQHRRGQRPAVVITVAGARRGTGIDGTWRNQAQ